MLLTPQPDTRSPSSIATNGTRMIRAWAAAERGISILRVQITAYVATGSGKSTGGNARPRHGGLARTGTRFGREMLYTPQHILLGSMCKAAYRSDHTQWRTG